MARTYYLSATDSDGPGAVGADFEKVLATAPGAAGAINLSLPNSSNRISFAWTPAGDPDTFGVAGTVTVEVNITLAAADVTLFTRLSRVNAAGTVQATSAESGGQSLATTGVKTFTFTDVDLGIWLAGDRLRVNYRFDNVNAHGANELIDIETDTTDAEVATPFLSGAFAVGDFAGFYRKSRTAVDGTSHTVMLPDGSNVSGRLVLVVFGVDGSTITWPSSPEFLQVGNVGVTGVVLAAAYRFIDGTEGFDGTDDSIVVSMGAAESSTAHVFLFTDGHHASTAPETATATGSGANADPPSLNPAGWDVEAALWVAAAGYRFNANFTVAPTNYAELLFSGSPNDDNVPLGTALRELSAASEDPGTFTSSDGGNWVSMTVAVRPAAAGQFVAVGQAVESEAAQAAVPARLVAAGQATESEAGQAAAAARLVAAGQAPESEIAQVVELGGGQTVAVGQALESEAAQAAVPARLVAAGQAPEAEAAQAAPPARLVAAAQAPESEAAQAAAVVKSAAVGQAPESEAALSVVAPARVDQAAESEAAQAAAALRLVAAGQAAESEAALAATALRAVPVGQAAEAEEGLSVVAPARVDPAAESEAALAVAAAELRAAGQALESEAAAGMAAVRAYAAGQVGETEVALSAAPRKVAAAGQALEAEEAQAVAGGGVEPVDQALELEAALAVSVRKIVHVPTAAESEAALAALAAKAVPVGQAAEAATALGVAAARAYPLALAVELEAALLAGGRKLAAAGQAQELESAPTVVLDLGEPPPQRRVFRAVEIAVMAAADPAVQAGR
jgi:hypothetical protein